MRKLVALLVICIVTCCHAVNLRAQSATTTDAIDPSAYVTIAKNLTKDNFILFADLSRPSNTYRFFVFDIKNRKIVLIELDFYGQNNDFTSSEDQEYLL